VELILAVLWMKNLNKFLIIFVSGFILWESNHGISVAKGWEYWSKYSFNKACCEKIGFGLEPEFRFKNNLREYYYSKTYFSFSYRPNKLIKIKASYAYKAKRNKNRWEETDLLYLDPTLKLNLQGIYLNNRFRFEYDLDRKELVYRDGVKLEKTFYKSLTPFIREEIFYSFLSEKLKENRFSVGLSVRVFERTGISGEYMLKSKRANSSWEEVNVAVTKINLLF